MAVAVENYNKGSQNDQSIFKVVAHRRLKTSETDTDYTNDFYTFHPCTEADYAKFHPVDQKVAPKVENFKARQGFFCLDWDNLDLEVYGNWATTNTY